MKSNQAMYKKAQSPIMGIINEVMEWPDGGTMNHIDDFGNDFLAHQPFQEFALSTAISFV